MPPAFKLKVKGLTGVIKYTNRLADGRLKTRTLGGAVDKALGAMAEEVHKDVIKRYRRHSDTRHPGTLEAYANPSLGLSPLGVRKNSYRSTRPFQRSGALLASIRATRMTGRKSKRHRYIVKPGKPNSRVPYRRGDPWDRKRGDIQFVADRLERGVSYQIQATRAMLNYLHAIKGDSQGQGKGARGKRSRGKRAGDLRDPATTATDSTKAAGRTLKISLPARPVWGPAARAMGGKPYRKFVRRLYREIAKLEKQK